MSDLGPTLTRGLGHSIVTPTTASALFGSKGLVAALLSLALVLGLLDATAPASASSAKGPLVATAPSFPLLANAQVSELQNLVTQSPNRTLFGGLVGDPSTHVVTIFLGPGQTSLAQASSVFSIIGTTSDPDITAEPKEWSVTFASTGTTLAALDDVLNLVQTAQPWRTDVDPVLVGYGIDPAAHQVDVLLSNITPQIAGEAQQLFGALVALQTMQWPSDNSGPTGQQLIDSQPYYGGDQLEGTCTAGFAAYIPSTNHRGMITAGHCFGQTGTGIYQGTSQVQTGVIGELGTRSYGNNLPDGEFIDATSPFGTTVDPQVSTTLPQGQPVTTTGTSWVGMQPCIDGSVTGENCTGTMQRTDFCIKFNDGYLHCAVDEVTNPNTSPIMCQPGDSGGPVYTTYSGTSLEAFDIHDGSNSGHDCFETEIGAVVAQLGAPLLTEGFQVPTPSASNILQPNATLNPNTWVSSQSTQAGVTTWKYFLIMQGTDGNLVLYAPSGAALWYAGTQGNPNAYAIMQGDGNLVVYKQGGVALWSSHTQNHPNAYLLMQADGNLVIYAQNGSALWWTNTCCHKP